MSKIKVYYAKLNNMGDLLSEYLIPAVTNRAIEHCEDVRRFEIMGVGSCGGAIWGNKEDGVKEFTKDACKRIYCIKNKEKCAVWGTGFWKDYYPRKLDIMRKNVSFIAVRGALSKRIIENSLGETINPVLCDGGILCSRLVEPIEHKEYEIGIISHYREQTMIEKNGLKDALLSSYKKAVFIDLHDDPIEVIRKIGKCELILSSSLHGCVVADSFHIPNIRVTFSNIPGSGFKFDDYYSGYNLSIPGKYIKDKRDIPTAVEIFENYEISPEVVEYKKDEMYNCLKTYVDCEIHN